MSASAVATASSVSSMPTSVNSSLLNDSRTSPSRYHMNVHGNAPTPQAAVVATAPPQDQQRTPTIDHYHHSRSEAVTATKTDTPLPANLRRILQEVAKTGTCFWLPWNSPDGGKEPPGVLGGVTLPSGGNNTSRLQPQNFSAYRRPTSSPYGATSGQTAPPRKKHRNGIHKNRRRFAEGSAAMTTNGTVGGKKRPLFLIRTAGGGTTAAAGSVSASSVCSGRTSGSEPDDSTQYECDSEGTSATTSSELSLERRDHLRKRANSKLMAAAGFNGDFSPVQYKTLQDAFRIALDLVLEYWFRHHGGYKLSPAEKRLNDTLSAAEKQSNPDDKQKAALSPEDIFQQRRERLVRMLSPSVESSNGDGGGNSANTNHTNANSTNEGPPFTIQRIAEVLLVPERYYTQTHKLCNCLEKLLLVTSSTSAFGGSTGGDTSQSRREELELAALADEKGRQESELRQRRLRRRTSSPMDESGVDNPGESVGTRNTSSPMREDGKYGGIKREASPSPEKPMEVEDRNISQQDNNTANNSSSREMMEAAARASLRTKFDHVGIDPHSPTGVKTIAENRGMTNSPPPPSLAMSSAPNMALSGHGGVSGFVRQHLPEQQGGAGDHPPIHRIHSPILFTPGSDPSMHSATNMHVLQLHHAASLAGVQASSPLELVTIDSAGNNSAKIQGAISNSNEGGDLEAEHGRSSASNSDIDSESSDVSLDDSASDRSDGSDSGSASYHEPFTAARAMALNRMQQQQRLQSRVSTTLNALQSGEAFRPPADSEYQSGDSIDSTRAEDSGGSDSSSSDLAD